MDCAHDAPALAVIVIALLLIAGCATSSPDAPPRSRSVWGQVVTAAAAEQTRAPAMFAAPDRVTLAWVSADNAGVHHDAAVLRDGRRTPITVLPLPPNAPRNSRLFPAAGRNNHHLLWLDADADGAAQLYSAVLDSALGVFRGPLQVSAGGARCYDAFSADDRTLWAVWHGGSPAAPALFSAHIDPTGLTLEVRRIAAGGGCPAAVTTASGRYLLWAEGERLHTAAFLDGRLYAPTSPAPAPNLRDGDRLRSLRGGADDERLYAFWNITRANGRDETWFTSGTPAAAVWDAPRLLSVTLDEAAAFDTTYNTGQSFAASEDASANGAGLAWAAPLRGVTSVLPVAGVLDSETLGVVYLRGGEVVGGQRVVTLNGKLLGAPELQTDPNRHLYLSWSEPQGVGAAALNITATRPLQN